MEDLQSFEHDKKEIPKLTNEQKTEIIKKLLQGGVPLKQFRGLSRYQMEEVTRRAFDLFDQQNYDEAEKIFQVLCFYDHLNKRYFIGLGASRQMQGKYRNAIAAYKHAAVLDVKDPRPHLHAGQCFFNLGDLDKARIAADSAKLLSDGAFEFERITDESQALLNQIENAGPIY